MKIIRGPMAIMLIASLFGCATKTQVIELIDASNQAEAERMKAQEESIVVLKKSAVAGLEQGREHGASLEEIRGLLEELRERLVKLEGLSAENAELANASKVLSAATTVRLAELETALDENTSADARTRETLEEIDRLYENAMIAHYERIARSATEAIESLRASGWSSADKKPVALDAPIEIQAPTAPTNNAPAERSESLDE